MPTHYSGTESEVTALDTFIKFTRANDAIEAGLFQQPVIEDLTASQFGVLETLFHLGPLCQVELSGKLLKSASNLTLVLDNLEKRGLVRRVRNSQDRRLVNIHLEPEGEDLIKRVFPRVVKRIEEQFAILSEDEQKTLGSLCRKLGRQIT